MISPILLDLVVLGRHMFYKETEVANYKYLPYRSCILFIYEGRVTFLEKIKLI